NLRPSVIRKSCRVVNLDALLGMRRGTRGCPVDLVADAETAGLGKRRTYPVEVRGGPHLGERAPCLTFSSTVEVRPDNFEHLNLRDAQAMRRFRWRTFWRREQSAVALLELFQVGWMKRAANLRNLLVVVGLKFRAGIRQLAMVEAQHHAGSRVE